MGHHQDDLPLDIEAGIIIVAELRGRNPIADEGYLSADTPLCRETEGLKRRPYLVSLASASELQRQAVALAQPHLSGDRKGLQVIAVRAEWLQSQLAKLGCDVWGGPISAGRSRSPALHLRRREDAHVFQEDFGLNCPLSGDGIEMVGWGSCWSWPA